jgi:ABC-type phosphate transport system substrate-binding protein
VKETMKSQCLGMMFRCVGVLCAVALLAEPILPAIKNLAIVTSAGSKVSDLPLAELQKYCKGATKTWPDGRNFTLVMKDPNSPEMHVAVARLFGETPAEVKASIAKLNETRQAVKIVGDDEELLQTVEATPGALGIVDVYSITSAVKVLRIDGKLPFDVGYAFKGN